MTERQLALFDRARSAWAQDFQDLLGDVTAPAARAHWESFYDDARDFVAMTAKRRGLDYDVVAGIVAIISPRLQWTTNVRVAYDVAAVWRHCIVQELGELDLDALPNVLMGSRKDSLARFYRDRAHGVFTDGPKVTAFYEVLRGDENRVVLDMWMVGPLALNQVSRSDYPVLEAAFLAFHDSLPHWGRPSPSRLQATMWGYYRNRQGRTTYRSAAELLGRGESNGSAETEG